MKVKRHPLRGLLGGVVLGVGVTLLLLTYAQAPFGKATLYVPVAVFVVLGVVLGVAAPARGRSAVPATPAVASRPPLVESPPSPPPPPPPEVPGADAATGGPPVEQ